MDPPPDLVSFSGPRLGTAERGHGFEPLCARSWTPLAEDFAQRVPRQHGQHFLKSTLFPSKCQGCLAAPICLWLPPLYPSLGVSPSKSHAHLITSAPQGTWTNTYIMMSLQIISSPALNSALCFFCKYTLFRVFYLFTFLSIYCLFLSRDLTSQMPFIHFIFLKTSLQECPDPPPSGVGVLWAWMLLCQARSSLCLCSIPYLPIDLLSCTRKHNPQ